MIDASKGRDINALGAFWEVFPGLRELLFSPNGREGHSDARFENHPKNGINRGVTSRKPPKGQTDWTNHWTNHWTKCQPKY